MINSLLVSSKFAPPRLGRKSVLRGRLLARLDDARHCRLLLLTASAGFGKTTLLAQWRQQLLKAGAEVAWLLLGSHEASLPQFRAYFTSAMSRLGLASEDDAALLTGHPGPAGVDALVAAIVNAAAAQQRELYLMLDDYHWVEDPAVHDLLYRLLNQAPDNLHLVIASRNALPIPTGRLLGRGQMVEIAAAELPFDAREVVDFIERNVSTSLREGDARLIHEHSLGWPAALQLVANRLNAAPRSATSPAELAERSGDLARYLEEDVLCHLPAGLIEFLEMLSVCTRFDAELAYELSGRQDAGDLIARIEADNLFVTRIELAEGRDWLRLHRLFADFLAARRIRHGADWERALQSRASRWFARQGLVAEAVRHARLAGDLDFAIEVVTQAAAGLHSLAHLGTLMRWVEELPAAVVDASDKLLHLGCWAMMLTDRQDQAEIWAERLAAALARSAAPAIQPIQLAMLRAGIAVGRDHTETAVAWLRGLEDGLPRHPTLASLVVTVQNAVYAANGDVAAAHSLHQRWQLEHAGEALSDHAIAASCSLFVVTMLEGDARHVERAAPALLARSENAYGPRSACASICALWLAASYYERGRVDEARALLVARSEGLPILSPHTMVLSAALRARLQWLDQDTHGALGTLTREEQRCRGRGLERGLALMLAAQAQIHLARGDQRRAATIQLELDALAVQYANNEGWRGEIAAIAALAAARLALGERDGAAALRQLDIVRADARRRKRRRILAVTDLLACAAHCQLGDNERAKACLAAARDAAEILGLVRTVSDETEAYVETLGHLLSSIADAPASILAAPPVAAPLAARADSRHCGGAIITDREATILRLLDESMSNKRIALTLNLGVDTVKKNLRQIYAKIGVSSRYDALIWAREHGVL